MKQLLEGELPHRSDTPMVDLRDLALGHIRAAERQEASGKRFIMTTSAAVKRSHVVKVVKEAFPELSRGPYRL